jgi:hypothetical protein
MTNAVTKNCARQEQHLAYVDFTYDNINGANFNEAIELPAGAVITGGSLVVTTGWTTATLDDSTPPVPETVHVTVGDSDDDDRYLTSTSVAAAGLTALVPTGYVHAAKTNIGVTLDFAPSAGAARLEVKYYIQNRATSSQG